MLKGILKPVPVFILGIFVALSGCSSDTTPASDSSGAGESEAPLTEVVCEGDGPTILSDGASTNKVKIMRTPDGTLFAVYGEAQDVNINGNTRAWEAKGNYIRKPYDIVIKFSLDGGGTWSEKLNIDNSAGLSSAKAILDPVGPPELDPETGTPVLEGKPYAVDYPGDSDKPNVRNIGNHIVITWNGKYCPGDEQRFVVYPELDGLTMPYSCQYVSRLVWNSTEKRFNTYEAWGGEPYKTDRLTSGLRDAKQDANRGNKFGAVINWQEDPLGLKLGQAEGPGDGASGANVNNGTDIWYTYLPLLNAAGAGVDTAKFVTGQWVTPSRVTKNVFTQRELSGRDLAWHPAGEYDLGNVGSSRPNIGQIDDQVIIAYEETKGTQGWDEGKYIRYHAFRFDQPPLDGEHGCVISDPWENARRVRFLVQSDEDSEVPLVFIYKQGNYTQGGPSDIMLRRSVGGVLPEHLDPPVDVNNCTASIMSDIHPMTAIDLAQHGPAMNLSGTRFEGDQPGTGGMGEGIDTEANALENALAHRGVMRGNNIMIGYSYVPDIYRFLILNDQTPYNFLMRRSTDGGATWTDAVNLTPQVTAESGVSVREPRMVPTPPSGPRCATDATDCQDTDVIFVAYGLQENVYSHQDSADVDIYMMVSTDGGETFSQAQAITSGDVLGGTPDDMEDFETQITVRPDGRENYTVWSGFDGQETHSLFRRMKVQERAQNVEGQQD